MAARTLAARIGAWREEELGLEKKFKVAGTRVPMTMHVKIEHGAKALDLQKSDYLRLVIRGGMNLVEALKCLGVDPELAESEEMEQLLVRGLKQLIDSRGRE